MIFRRRRLPERLEEPSRAFEESVGPLERARTVLTESVPGTRLPGRPLAETLLAFEEGLRELRRGMDAWRVPELEREWLVCRAGLDDALALAERARVEGVDPSGFEGLTGLIADLHAPLDAFRAAEDRLRELRV